MVDCSICRGPCHEIGDKKSRIYHVCRDCGFTFLDPSSRLREDEEKKRYDQHNNTPGARGYIQWLTAFLEEAVLPFADEGCAVLDFGSGPVPVLARLMEERGYKVSIHDKYFAPHMPQGPFDLITSTEVFEHLADPLGTLKYLKEILTPGGRLSIKTSLRPLSDEEFLSWWYREDSTHISFFSAHSLNALASKSGVTLEFCDSRSVAIFRN